MSDLIDRQTAIKAIEDLPNCYNGFSDTYDKSCIIGVLEEVPSAQPNLQQTCNKLATDCISRQAAIGAIKEFQLGAAEWKDEQEEGSDIWHRADSAIASAIEIGLRVKKLPSAQRTGRWIEDSGNIACSECHIIWLHRRTAFCPNCGAKMGGEHDGCV